MKYIVSYGTLNDGFDFVGPFDTAFEASEFLLRHIKGNEDWHICEIETMTEAEDRWHGRTCDNSRCRPYDNSSCRFCDNSEC